MEEPKLIKKKSFTEKLIRNQAIFFPIVIVLVITMLVGTSYSLLTNFDTSNNAIVVKEGDMRMTINNTEGKIALKNRSYISDKEGLKNATPIIISLSNTGNFLITKFDVMLEVLNKTTLDRKYLKYAYSTDSGVNYSDPENLGEDGIIYTGYNLLNNKSRMLYLKIWIDEASGVLGVNKSFYGNINVKLYDTGDVPYASNVVKKSLDQEKGISRIAYNRYQFLKSDVNNYIKFNNELWRIIGIYAESENEYLRVIRNDALDSKIISNEYDGKDLLGNKEAIKNFLNSESDKYSNRGYLSFLNNNARNMIKGREFGLIEKSDADCKWMEKYGDIKNLNSLNTYYVRPVVNLLPTVIVTSGDGSKESPYELAL